MIIILVILLSKHQNLNIRYGFIFFACSSISVEIVGEKVYPCYVHDFANMKFFPLAKYFFCLNKDNFATPVLRP